jgi:hypothetical protein
MIDIGNLTERISKIGFVGRGFSRDVQGIEKEGL